MRRSANWSAQAKWQRKASSEVPGARDHDFDPPPEPDAAEGADAGDAGSKAGSKAGSRRGSAEPPAEPQAVDPAVADLIEPPPPPRVRPTHATLCNSSRKRIRKGRREMDNTLGFFWVLGLFVALVQALLHSCYSIARIP